MTEKQKNKSNQMNKTFAFVLISTLALLAVG